MPKTACIGREQPVDSPAPLCRAARPGGARSGRDCRGKNDLPGLNRLRALGQLSLEQVIGRAQIIQTW